MATAIQSNFSINDSVETSGVNCSSCSDNGDNSAAGHYCVDCEIYMCFKCLKCHNKIPVTKLHQVNDVESNGQDVITEETKPRDQPESNPSQRLRCHVHPGKSIDSYCMDHEELCCGSCVVIKHRTCKTAMVATLAKDLKVSSQVKECENAFIKIINDLNNEVERRSKNLASIEKDEIQMLEKVDKYENEIIERIKHIAEASRSLIRDKSKTHMNEINHDSSILTTAINKTVCFVDKFNATDEEQLFTNVKIGQSFIKEIEAFFKSITSKWSERGIQFQIDCDIIKYVNERKYFGFIQDRENVAKGKAGQIALSQNIDRKNKPNRKTNRKTNLPLHGKFYRNIIG